MRTWEELDALHIKISRILLAEKDASRIRLQSAELDMLAFFRQHHKDESAIRIMKEALEAGINDNTNKITLARIAMCNWFINEKKTQEPQVITVKSKEDVKLQVTY